MLRWFAGRQIRNVSSVAGNIVTSSPISDLNPLFQAVQSRIFLQSSEGGREVQIDENFFTGYRRNIIRPEEILVWIEIPTTSPDEVFKGYKQARRREDDIAIVNAGMFVQFHPGSRKVKDIRLSFGGMAP
ncbi:unnamed protein product, partial [Darwinula stevensoni]